MSKKLDNLIPLRTRLDGPQYGGWQPSQVAESGLGCQLLADVMVTMPDGIRLSADVYLPLKPGKYPVILQFAPYNRDLHTIGVPTGNNEIGAPPISTDRGYVQVVFTARGVGRSEGTFQSWQCPQEIDDHFHCIEWASKQEWSSGDVCLFGTSYYALSQFSVAAKNPPALRACFANELCTDFYRQVFRYGGAFNSEFLTLWIGANFNPDALRRKVSPWKRALLSYVINRPWLWKKLVKPRIDKILDMFKKKKVNKEALKLYINAMIDSHRREDTKIASGPYKDLDKINIPFVAIQNMGNVSLHQFGSYDVFQHTSTPPDKKWLILGPAEFELPVFAWQSEALAFFDYIIKGTQNGYAQLPHVRYWLEGKESFDSATDFPVPEAKSTKFYLNGDEKDLNTHHLQLEIPSEAAQKNSWISIPVGAKVLPGIDELEASTLRYHFPIQEDIEVIGPLVVQLNYSCNEIDSYIVTRLCRRDNHGKSHILSMGHFRPATRTIDKNLSNKCEIVIDYGNIEPLKPHVPVLLRFSMTPASSYFSKGDTLVFEIASRTDLLSGTFAEGFVTTGLIKPPYFCRNWIHYGEESFIEIPLKKSDLRTV